MNRKFSTLVAAAMLATGVNGWAQVTIDAGTATTDGYTVQASTAGALFDQFVREDASSQGNKLFPTVSPFELKTAYGAKPISALQHTNGVADGRYFQFAISQSFHAASAVNGDGKEILTMVWVANKGTLASNVPVNGHFEVQVENVNNANVSNNRITLDRTLWKVTAHKDAAGTVLYYQLQNKASEAILQLSIDNIVGTPLATGEAEIALEIVNGQTDWRWADGQVAAQSSKIENAAGPVLQNQFRAQYNNGMTIRLARKVASDGKITLGAVKMNSNRAFATNADVVTFTAADGSTTKFYPITFESWEANPIILNAAQINAELGNEELLTEDQKTPNKFHFVFNPDVEGDENVMLASDFVAVAPMSDQDAYKRLPGDTPDGYVRFRQNGTTDKYLRVDTAYHDPSLNGRYDLKLTVDQITYPRYAVAKDGLQVNSSGKLTKNGNVLSEKAIYGDKNLTSDANYTARAYAQLKRQSNFRPIFYPATQSLRLQAEMIYKAEKKALNAKDATYRSWWEQMAEDAMWQTSSDTKGTIAVANGYMGIAGCATDPSIDPVNKPAAARGYYPSYTQTITAAAGVYTVEQGLRLIHYAQSWGPLDLTVATERNGYSLRGANDIAGGANKMLWNAVGNVYQGSTTNVAALASAQDDWSTGETPNVFVFDPAATDKTTNTGLWHLGSTPNGVEVTKEAKPVIYAPEFALAHSNLTRLVTLTPTHKVLTSAVHDMVDDTYNGLNTYITLKTTKTEPELTEVADIDEGFYYIRNAKNMNSDLTEVDAYRYEDLAATNAMFGYWNALTKMWDRGVSAIDNGNGAKTGFSNAANTNEAIAEEKHKNDNSNEGNLVYSADKKVIPSAQWYIKGNGGYYTLINRESGRAWGTSYWWKTSEPNVFANQATYTDATGLKQTYRDTIRIERIPLAELTNQYLGYLNMSQEVAKADTSLYSVGMTSLGDVRFSLGEENGVLKMIQDAKGDYKLERALIYDKDIYSQEEQKTDSLYYGYVPSVNGKIDSTKMLVRAKYYIYQDEVSANSGIEESSIMTRKYFTLESGRYRLTEIRVQKVNDDYTVNLDADEKAGTENVKNRRAFYVKQISTEDPTQFVLVDPMVVTQTENASATKIAYGARLFANQMTAEVQPGSLISNGYANSYASSIFNIEQKQAYNYVDIRPAGIDRDTVEFFAAKLDGQYLLSENTGVKGANVGLLESLDKTLNKNNALFLDTANVHHPECPRFLLAIRNTDFGEAGSNIDEHNHHWYTDADYLVNMVDSVAKNDVYVYKNQDFNQTKFYRLGFVTARHQGTTLTFKSGKEYDLSSETLGANGLNIATFAFRCANTDRKDFYIETMYDKNTRGWLKTINHVLVVTPEIQQADVFSFNRRIDGTPTANEAITASNVTVEGGNGIVIIKGAAAKQVTVCNVLGQTLASTVLSSDEATIAVPAGIVVVAVEGEAAVKTVVK
ncbi:DUF6383 domain-containing protein [Parabacteroides sp.]